MDLSSRFECWRELVGPKRSWGLAWFLATEFCQRFYASHGLVPWVIFHEGLGYYGISIHRVHYPPAKALGRFTMAGDVENWRKRGPGDHRLKLTEQCENGVPTSELVRAAIAEFELPPIPLRSHIACRHKRWGASYVLVFEVAACLALQYRHQDLEIWNHPAHVEKELKEQDPQFDMKEHPGGFLFRPRYRGNELLIAGDGRVLDDSNDNLWTEYMKGQSVAELAKTVEHKLNVH